MKKYIPIFMFVFSGCAVKPFRERQDECLKLMRENRIPVCHYMEDMDDMSEYEVGFEIGMSSGFFEGCMTKAREE